MSADDCTFFHQQEPLLVIGIALRTCNEQAGRTIPPHWGRFAQEDVLDRIPQRVGDAVYAVYAHFEHEGVDNDGEYSLVIGAAVHGRPEVPVGMVSVVVPATRRACFAVERGRPDLVGARWQQVWQRDDLAKTYLADFERYGQDGVIDLCIGIESA